MGDIADGYIDEAERQIDEALDNMVGEQEIAMIETRKTTRVYLAGPLFTDPQKEVIFKIHDWLVEDDRFEVFSPWHASQPIWNGRAPKDCSQSDRQKVFDGNWSNIEWCDILLAWVGGWDDGKTDMGVCWEMGLAFHKKPIIAYVDEGDERQSMNLMLERTVDAVANGFDEVRAALIHHHYYPGTYVQPFPELMLTNQLTPEQDAIGPQVH